MNQGDDLEQRIVEMITKLQLSSLATITQDGKPWTRYVMCAGDEKMVLRCATLVGARKVPQIQATPEVHVTCGVSDPMQMKPYLQIQARAQLATDTAARLSFWYPMLAQIFEGPDDPNYGVIVMHPYRIEYCTPGKMVPEVWERGSGQSVPSV